VTFAYVDGISGASGDMLLGALLAAGWPAEELQRTLGQFPLSGWELHCKQVVQHGIAATQVRFDLPGGQPLRRLRDLLALLKASRLPSHAQEEVARVLSALAQAEAGVHGTTVDDVHFHEIGALDTLFDVTGVVAGLAALGVSRLLVGPVNVGGGSVRIAHGLVPVPPPAVALLARRLITYGAPDAGELLTPTGAALLATLGEPVEAQPPLRVQAVGYGAGQKSLPHANVVRLTLGQPVVGDAPTSEALLVLNCNLDDMQPELYSYVWDRLFEAGALDVWLSPIQMKKGRPAVLLSVLAEPERASSLRHVLFRETTTLGVRTSQVQRDRLERQWETVRTPYGDVRVKMGVLDGEVVNRAPEYEDCAAAASAHGAPLKLVYEAALRETSRHRAGQTPPLQPGALGHS